ncbi:membrane protein [Pseudoalteromonas atlantica]|uniref:Membrane protein n=2 Tax=Pseudoalteromonas TaxID=53246 RepID=A0ABQ0UGF7_PSEAF|nr:membrane protein [Pseudoalteromonas atlantica]|tara:strand:+ start:173 stop:1297 length:1125 start_codon:yes stop_codon:yes gene_type:complete
MDIILMESIHPTPPETTPAVNEPAAPIFSGKVQFSGKGGEFFGIWIVNILLSVLTLGIYSAWAKVRTMRYFYGHTRIDGHSFDYLATPMQILKGRILAVIVFLIYSFGSSFFPLVGLLFAVAFIFLMPWIINQGLRFNMRMTRHRNVRFAFKGDYGEAFINFILLPIASIFTLYLLMPYVLKRIDTYIHSNISYGDTPLTVNLKGETYYLTALICFVVSSITMVIFMAVLGLFGLDLMNVENQQAAQDPAKMGIMFGGLMIAYVFMIAIVTAVWAAAIRNHIFDNSQFEDVASFKSELKPIPFAILLLTNMLAIVFSLGLAYPWTKVRTSRMLAEVTTVNIYPSALNLVDTAQQEQSSFAEEAANVFDIDLSLT